MTRRIIKYTILLLALALTAGTACIGPPEEDCCDPWTIREGDGRREFVDVTHPPRWTPDGQHLVFTNGTNQYEWSWDLAVTAEIEELPAHGNSVNIINIHGSELNRISEGESIRGSNEADVSVDVFPEGGRVAFATARHVKFSSVGYHRNFKIEIAYESDPTRGGWDKYIITDHIRSGMDSSPKWSPDGERIAFSRHKVGIITISPTTSGDDPRIAYPPIDNIDKWPYFFRPGSVQWLSNRRIAFECAEINEGHPIREWSMLCAADIDSINLEVLHRIEPKENSSVMGPLALSPDGRNIAFVRTGPGQHPKNDLPSYNHLIVSEVGNKEERQIGPAARPGMGIAEVTNTEWSPDGTKILISATEDHEARHSHANGLVTILDVNGKLVGQMVDRGKYASWSPDGSMIATSEGWGATPARPRFNFLHIANADGTNVRPLLTTYIPED